MTQLQKVCEENVFDLPATVNLHGTGVTLCEAAEVGDIVENCRLVAQLGSGSSGRVFLARQISLADRAIVLKVTVGTHQEHLNLARLQHTNIMPLYWASSLPHQGLRVLAMPYLAKATLSRLLERLGTTPIATWDGNRVFTELQADQDELPLHIPLQEHAVQQLKQSTWIDFVLRLGQTLAEALAFAHQRNLLHLDVKPSNILITPDGQPILLDLDVARQPITAGTTSVPWFGGTPGYMSPEQRQAMQTLAQHQPVTIPVDERSDIYSLGVVLYLALGGTLDDHERPGIERLPHLNPRVGREVLDIVGRCIAEKPSDRYPDCAALAADLERQLHDLPLQGVPERLPDRWRKWRRRRPFGLPLLLLFACFAAAVGFGSFSVQQRNAERRQQAESALLDGQDLLRQGHFEAAARRLGAGKEIAAHTFASGELREQLARRLRTAERLQHAQELDNTVRLMRYYVLEERTPRRLQHVLEAAGRKLWNQRGLLTDRSAGELEPALERNIDRQLQELVLLWSDGQMRLAPASHQRLVRAEVHKVISQAEQRFGACFAVKLAKDQHGVDRPDEAITPNAAWEHCALGRVALAQADLDGAGRQFQQAFELDPLDPVGNFYLGVLAHRQKRHHDAVQAFSFCLGKEPFPECFVLRGEAFVALGLNDRALRDFQHALDRKPDFALAYRQRGRLHELMGRPAEAERDRRLAQQLEE